MNKTMQKIALLMLSMVSACAAEVGPTPDEEPAPNVPMAAPSVPTAAPPRRDGGPFSQTVRDQLAERGIHVHDGSKSQGERTTVEQDWIVPGYPTSRITETDPTTVPLMYSTQLGILWPRYVKTGAGAPYIDAAHPGEKGSCSGTVVAGDAVLTAAHCVTNWLEIGNDLATGAPVKRRVRAYAIRARPRRNSNDKPYGEFNVTKSYYPFNTWPAATETGPSAGDHDYAILRFRTPTTLPIPGTTVRSLPTPAGTFIEFGHYPFAFTRENAGLYYSVGDIDTVDGGLYPGRTRVYRTRASLEPGSSGAGVFEFGVNGVAGVVSSENPRVPGTTRVKGQQYVGGFPNQVLMFSPTEVATVNGWMAAPAR